jgi:phosphoribosylamine---glycine ligase
MNVLLVGGGGREHALAWTIARSPLVTRFFAAPGNPGIARHATCVELRADDVDGLGAFAERERIDLVVVGPEAPLVAGLADRLRERGLAIFGPSASAAQLEGSKAFAKSLMARHRVPTARFGIFTEAASARRYARELGAPVVVKASGLAAGKGAIVCATLEEADRALAACLEDRAFGAAGQTVVVEEFLVGEEASFFVVTNGTDAVPLAAAQDHKTVFDGDRGPNTGGMGAFSPTASVDLRMRDRIMGEIVRPTLAALAADGTPYRGVLYVGLMLTREGPKVIEFNCRFGDPECQAIAVRADVDWLPLLLAAARGEPLGDGDRWAIDWSGRMVPAGVSVTLASGGYPESYKTGFPITGIERAETVPGVHVFHAGTVIRDGRLVTAGGRVLSVTADGDSVAVAIERAYEAVHQIAFEGMHYRRDIGRRPRPGASGSPSCHDR